MQDKYAGDVGDFGKFSLLRALLPEEEYKLGVVWYLFPDEGKNDGRHVSYLDKQEYKKCDGYVHGRMKQVIDAERSVHALEKSGVLPEQTVYYDQLLDSHLKYTSQSQEDTRGRLEHREVWVRGALQSVSKCDAVFLDPDNGLEIKSCSKRSQMNAGKYLYLGEVKQFCASRKICVIYHHLNRSSSHENQVKYRVSQLEDAVGSAFTVMAVRFTPYSPRAYFIVVSCDEFNQLQTRLSAYLKSPCGSMWKV